MKNNKYKGDIPMISNELEFNLLNIKANDILDKSDLSIFPEVNLEHVIELTVSETKNIKNLNSELDTSVNDVSELAKKLGGEIYAGGTLFEDVSSVEPARYRTTCLSESCAKGFLDVTSQQIVIGVSGEEFGINLFNYLKDINPSLLALSNASPHKFGSNLNSSNIQSRRINQYKDICSNFPSEILETSKLKSTENYFEILQDISDKVNNKLDSGELDINEIELFKDRSEGAYAPFDRLDPHQIYWMNRFRPDHSNSDCDFSIELRAPDLPTTTERMKMLNSYVLGLCYNAADNGFDNLPEIHDSNFNDLMITSVHGLDSVIGGKKLNDTIIKLGNSSLDGLNNRGFHNEANNLSGILEKVLTSGNDANLMLNHDFNDTNQMKNYLVSRLTIGE